MKTILFLLLVVALISDDDKRILLIAKQNEIDSLKLILADYRQDTILFKMANDLPYRTKVNTLTNMLSDKEMTRIINKKHGKKI